jgi:Zn-dependent protease with chaperone function
MRPTASSRTLHTRPVALLLSGAALLPAAALAAGLAAVVHKPSADVHAEPDLASATVATLPKDAAVSVAAQQGLWYQLEPGTDGTAGYVRVNAIRLAGTGAKKSDTLQVLLTAKSGRGRVSETAGVRGIEESELRSAGFDAAQLDAMHGHRVAAGDASAWAAGQGLAATTIPWPGEAAPSRYEAAVAAASGAPAAPAPKKARGGAFGGFAKGLLGGLGGSAVASAIGVAEKAVPQSGEELAQAELELGPMVAGRVLGARPLWDDADAQHRVNVVGRWVASNTTRPDLPWTFAVIDSPELNAFAAPGGYVLVTRGLYELLESDAELAAVLGHEIGHVVQRDHYEVVRKQELAASLQGLVGSQVPSGGSIGESLARGFVERHGAAMLMTRLDREAEHRADAFAQLYLARSGLNPLALYAVLQKMAAVGGAGGGLAQLYSTHPTLASRLDRLDQRGYGVLEPYLAR